MAMLMVNGGGAQVLRETLHDGRTINRLVFASGQWYSGAQQLLLYVRVTCVYV